jgi:FkbM family methyltransferase
MVESPGEVPVLTEKTNKPSPWTSPVAWTRRQIGLKFGDLLRLAGLSTMQRVDFRNMTGADFAHVIDVGVADGSHDLYDRFPNAYLDLFEPHPGYQDVITKQILTRRRGRMHPVALGREKGTATLFLKGRTGSSLVHDFGRGDVSVPVERIDEMLTGAEIKRPSMLKIDTEGYELAVLDGASGILDHIDCVVVEIHFHKPDQYRPDQIVALLAERGFGLAEMLDFYVGNHRVTCADFVFRRIAPAVATPTAEMVAAVA